MLNNDYNKQYATEAILLTENMLSILLSVKQKHTDRDNYNSYTCLKLTEYFRQVGNVQRYVPHNSPPIKYA
jgi:hypothetical protein